MSSKDYFELQRRRVEEAIDRLLPKADTRPSLLNEAIRYSVLTGGKRLRPILSITAADAVQGPAGDFSAAINSAVAVEFLHSYTLIHDDLPAMDNDLLRRGQPTVHAKYGEGLAILAGDALQAFAFDVISRPSNLSPSRTMRAVHELTLAAGPAGVVGGQVEDIAGNKGLTEDRLQYVFRHKTADLFRAALRIGAITGGGDDDAVEAMGAYGTNLGIAFQVIDDLLDAPDGTPPEEELSCLHLWSRDKAMETAKAYTTEAVAALSSIPGSPATAMMADVAQKLLTRVV